MDTESIKQKINLLTTEVKKTIHTLICTCVKATPAKNRALTPVFKLKLKLSEEQRK